MRTIHLDAVGGIAGDMFVAAMLDAFPDLRERVLADGAAVLPDEAGAAELVEGESGAVRALRFGLKPAASGTTAHVATPTPDPSPQGGSGTASAGSHTSTVVLETATTVSHSPLWGGVRGGSGDASIHSHTHKQGKHSHSHAESDAHSHDGDHHRPDAHSHHHTAGGSFRDMVARIEMANLSKGTAAHAVTILTILAKAEGRIHLVPMDEVHFHEIADWDSLLDVVAAGSIAAALEDTQWTVSPLPRGGGLVHTAHGLLPVPAPATVAILEGFSWRDDGISGERVTPTGAAILKHLVKPGAARAEGRLVASGTGAGTRTLPGMPNILRVLAFETETAPSTATVTVISFDIDDMTGEEIGVAADRLRTEEGVLDLSIGQRQGKKGRPLSSFRLLARPEHAEAIAERCFDETSTIGLRLREERRLVLAREAVTVDGIGVKAVARPGGTTRKAESDALAGDSLAERRAAKLRAERDTDA